VALCFPNPFQSTDFGNHSGDVIPKLLSIYRLWESLSQCYSLTPFCLQTWKSLWRCYSLTPFCLQTLGITLAMLFPNSLQSADFGNHFHNVIPKLIPIYRLWESLWRCYSLTHPNLPTLGITSSMLFPNSFQSTDFGNHFGDVIPKLLSVYRLWESLWRCYSQTPFNLPTLGITLPTSFLTPNSPFKIAKIFYKKITPPSSHSPTSKYRPTLKLGIIKEYGFFHETKCGPALKAHSAT
jgi:hypothetical protein